MKRYFYDWLFYVVLWVVVTLFYTFITLSLIRAIIEYVNIEGTIIYSQGLQYIISYYQYIEALLFGILFGTATFGINLVVDYSSINKLSFGKTIIIKTLLYFVAIAVIFVLMAGIIMTSGLTPFTPEEYRDFVFVNPMPKRFYIAVGGFFIMSTLLINFIALVSKKFGPGQMLLIFLGKYNKPITENRIFMFLDLNDSTTIAEKLGHIIYSKLLQECFLDLNKLIPKSGAEIYQYVGDEAVLTWKIKNYDENFMKPIRLFYYFKRRLDRKAKYYQNKFGVIPEFKAGLNAGVVTVAEIGDIKREIAYHGDVVNTASRLRDACNEFGKKLLASTYVIRNINKTDLYNVNEIGEVNLKGKVNSIKVYSIEQS